MNKEQLEAIAARADKALATVVALDQGDIEWRMSIPARPDKDPDLIIMDSLEDIPRLVVEVDNLQGKCHRMLNALRRIGGEANAVLYELDPFTVAPSKVDEVKE